MWNAAQSDEPVCPIGTLLRRIKLGPGEHPIGGLSRRLKVSDGTIRQWEWGDAQPTVEQLRRLGEFANVPADAFLELRERRPGTEIAWQKFLDAHGDELSREERTTLANMRFEPPLRVTAEVFVTIWAALRLGGKAPR